MKDYQKLAQAVDFVILSRARILHVLFVHHLGNIPSYKNGISVLACERVVFVMAVFFGHPYNDN